MTASTEPDVRAVATPIVRLAGVTRRYGNGEASVDALAGVDLAFAPGELVAILGASGSGKSTLLNLLAGIDRPSSGEVIVSGQSLHALSQRALSRWRGNGVGLVFQFFQLLPTLTALENVMLPMDFARRGSQGQRRERATSLLAKLGVAALADRLPGTLSGGQQQRVAVARALANDPPLLLADEPTGNLDSANAAALLALLRGLAAEGRCVVVVTHDAIVGAHATRIVTLRDGRVACDEPARA
jgi:putative ABC transport system ATP-binding protein